DCIEDVCYEAHERGLAVVGPSKPYVEVSTKAGQLQMGVLHEARPTRQRYQPLQLIGFLGFEVQRSASSIASLTVVSGGQSRHRGPHENGRRRSGVREP